MKIYIDESGFTGADYCNSEQPLYVLACTWFDDDFSKSIEEPLLKEFGHNELKFNKLVKSKRGRAAIIEVIDKVTAKEVANKFAGYVIHKKSALTRKFVMDCVEPFCLLNGVDMMKEGGNVAYANLISSTMPAFMGVEWFDRFLLLYNDLIRFKTEASSNLFFEHCQRSKTENQDAFEVLSPYLRSPDLIFEEFNTPYYREDLYEMIVMGLVVHIRNVFDVCDFEMVLDSTKATSNENLTAFLKSLELLTRDHKMSEVCTVRDDIKISSVCMVDSKDEVGVRMSDLIAGIFSWTLKSESNMQSDIGKAFFKKIEDNNFIHMINSTDVTAQELGMSGSTSPW